MRSAVLETLGKHGVASSLRVLFGADWLEGVRPAAFPPVASRRRFCHVVA